MILIFDLDDTLYDELTYVKSGLSAVAKFGQEAFSLNAENSYLQLERLLTTNGRGRIFDDWLKTNNFFSKINVTKCIQVYRHHRPKIQLYPGVRPILKSLGREYPLYLVTDGHKVVQEKKVVALRLEKHFKRVLVTHRFGVVNAKPSLYCFDLIRRAEGGGWGELFYIGDNPRKDFVNLNGVGVNTIRVLSGQHAKLEMERPYEAKALLRSVIDLPMFLEALIRN
jgi:putative hydrolase of the HAD superfamily